MKKRSLFPALLIMLFLMLSGSFAIGQSAKVLTQTHLELESAFEGKVEKLAKEHAEVFLGRGSREAKLVQMVNIDYGEDQEVMVLMLYKVVVEHARGGDEFYAALVWSETQKMFIQEELELGNADDIRFSKIDGDWAVIERVNYFDDSRLPEFVWYNLETREVRIGFTAEKLPPRALWNFVQKDDGASDIWWELEDEKELLVPLTDALRAEIAEVRHVEPALIGGNHYAVYFLGEKLRLLDLDHKSVSTLMTLYADTEGLSGFSIAPQGKDEVIRIAFANLNPNRYENHSKIFVLDIKNGQLLQKQKFDADLHYGVKGNSPYNLIIAGEDFWFNGRDEIQYRENPMTTDSRMGFGEWDMTTYPFKVKAIVVE
jgi:hypothetical protein